MVTGAAARLAGEITVLKARLASIERTNQLDYASVKVNGQSVALTAGLQAGAQAGLDAANAIAAAATAQAKADGAVVTYYDDTAPAGAKLGDFWVDTNGHVYTWGGAAWAPVTSQAVVDALDAAAGAQATADGKIVTYFQATSPTSPSVGDCWFDTAHGNHLYRWNGVDWDDAQDQTVAAAVATADRAVVAAQTAQAAADGRVTTYFTAGAPTGAALGDLWFDAADGNHLYRWTGTAWADAADAKASAAVAAAADAQATADGKIVTWYQATSPTAPAIGDLWIDTGHGNHLYRWSGTAWVDSQDTAIAGAATAASTAQAAANAAATAANNARAAADAAVAGAATAQATADGKVQTFFQTTPPTGMGGKDVGDMWFDTDDGNHLYRWTGSQWADAQDSAISAAAAAAAGANSAVATKITTYYGAAAPTTATAGDLWVDTGNGNRLARWDGTKWVSIQDSAIAAAASAAGSAQTAANTAQSTANSAVSTATAAQTAANTAQATAAGKITTYSSASQPTGATVGDLWVNTNAGNMLYRWTGSSWVPVQDSAITTAQSTASTALSTANSKIITYWQGTQPSTTGQVPGNLWADTSHGNHLYRWDGYTWQDMQDAAIGTALTTANSKIVTYYQATAPSTANVGDLWVDSAHGAHLYRWNGTAWTDIQDAAVVDAQTAANTALATANSKIVTYYQATAPTTHSTGDMWIDTAHGNHLYRWSGTAWIDIQDTAIGAAQAAATNASNAAAAAQAAANTANANATTAQTTANGKNTVTNSTSAPSGAGKATGDIWYQRDATSRIIAQWYWTGSAWVGQTVTDAMIANLSAGKITTGAIAASQKIIAGPVAGTRAEITSTGIVCYAKNDDGSIAQTVSLGTASDDYLGVVNGSGLQVASIDSDGMGNFAGLSVTGDPTFQGTPLSATLSGMAQGLVSWANIAGAALTGVTAPTGTLELSAYLYPGRVYQMLVETRVYVDTAPREIIFTINTAGKATPTVSSQQLHIRNHTPAGGNQWWDNYAWAFDLNLGQITAASGEGLYRFLLVFGPGNVGSGAVNMVPEPTMTIVDLGPLQPYTGAVNRGVSGSTTTPAPSQHTTTWGSVWSASWRGDGTKRTDTNDVVQGYYDSLNGNQQGAIGFPSLTSALSGAGISKVEVYLYSNHWFYSAGGSVVMNLHGAATEPTGVPARVGSKGDWVVSGWPNPGGRWVTIPTDWWVLFQNGTAKGITIGPGPSTSGTYYGRFNGDGASSEPQIRVTYVK